MTRSTTAVLKHGIMRFATSQMFSHAQTRPAYAHAGASGFVGRFQLPFARPLATDAATPSAADMPTRATQETRRATRRGEEAGVGGRESAAGERVVYVGADDDVRDSSFLSGRQPGAPRLESHS
jgi:hypothetical protein